MIDKITSVLLCPAAGDDVPKGRDAVGWRVAVYWKDDRTFYEGTLADYEPSSARHKVRIELNIAVVVLSHDTCGSLDN